MGDPFKKVRPGQPLEIPAETFNTFIDAARDFKARQRSLERRARLEFHDAGIIRIRNESGADRSRFDVLGIDRPIIRPHENLASFQNQIACIGVRPTQADHFGRFAVLLEPLAAGQIGRGCLSGICPARLNVVDEGHEFADVEDGCPENLMTGTAGSASILWKEPRDYADYGGCYGYASGYDLLRWGLVRIGNRSGGEEWGLV